MIFVHSSFRTGSTYLWWHLRKCELTIAYYEVFNEILQDLSPAQAPLITPCNWKSHHPQSAPYFLEFLPLIRPVGGVEGFPPDISYGNFIPVAGCLGQISEPEAHYVKMLVAHAEDRGRIPVLTSTRSLGRIRGLKVAAPGFHLLLYRNLYHQWCSFTQQDQAGNPYFLDRLLDIIRLNSHDPVLRELQQVFPLHKASVINPDTFCMFVLLHLHLYVQGVGASDLVVDLNRLESEQAHREAVEQALAGQAVRISLSDAKNRTSYALCELGSTAKLQERLKVMGDFVLDRAPDSAGRSFGKRVLSDLIDEYDRQAFYTGALRSAFLDARAVIAKHADLPQRLEAASADSDRLKRDHEAATQAQKRLEIDREMIANQREQERLQHEVFAAREATLRLEHEGLAGAFNQLSVAHDALTIREAALRLEHDALLSAHETMHREHDLRQAQADLTRRNHDALVTRLGDASANLSAAEDERNRLMATLAGMLVERDELQAQSERGRIEFDQQRVTNNRLTTELATVSTDLSQSFERITHLVDWIVQLNDEISQLVVRRFLYANNQSKPPSLRGRRQLSFLVGRNWKRGPPRGRGGGGARAARGGATT